MHDEWKQMKKEGNKGLTSVWRQKPLKKNGGKQQKIDLTPWPIEEREKGVSEKVLNSEEHVRNKGFKKLSIRFSIDRKLDSIDRKSHSIDLALIKQWSSLENSNQVFYRNFDRLSNRFDRSKNLEKSIFWKTKHFNAETPQSIMFYE